MNVSALYVTIDCITRAAAKLDLEVAGLAEITDLYSSQGYVSPAHKKQFTKVCRELLKLAQIN